jgi:hypothetical protein
MAAIIPDTNGVRRVSVTTLADYLTASASNKIDCVKEKIRAYDTEYRRGPGFYDDFKGAVIRGRQTGADHLAMQHVVSAQHDVNKHKHYTTLAEHWLALTELHQSLVSWSPATWLTPRLAVSIRPDFAIANAKGELFTVKLWLKECALGNDAVRALQRLFELHMTYICPGANPLVVDVRQGKVYRPTRRPLKRGFDEWLENEAGSLAGLWEKLSAA